VKGPKTNPTKQNHKTNAKRGRTKTTVLDKKKGGPRGYQDLDHEEAQKNKRSGEHRHTGPARTRIKTSGRGSSFRKKKIRSNRLGGQKINRE